jgi:hypothetical protein
MESVKNFARECMYNYDWKLDDLRTRLDLLVLYAGSLEIQHQ